MKTTLSRSLTIGVAVSLAVCLLAIPVGMRRAVGQSPTPPNRTATATAALTATAEAAATEAQAAAQTATATWWTPTPTPLPPTATPPDTIITESAKPTTTSRGDVFWLTLTALLVAWSILMGLLLVFAKAIKHGEPLKQIRELGRPALEGIALVMVVVAVIILGGQGVLKEQGIIAILSAIVGFLLGRVASQDGGGGGGGNGGGAAGGGNAGGGGPG